MIVRPVLYASWGEMLRSRIRLGLLALFFLPALYAAFSHSTNSATSGRGALYVVILGAGLIGRPVTTGTLALMFSRPVRRYSYVLTRWFAAWSAAAVLAIACNLIITLEAARSGGVDWTALGIASVEDVLTAAGTGAVLLLLSSVIGGVGDAALMAILMVGGAIFQKLGSFLSKPLLSWIGFHVGEWVAPNLDVVTVFRSTPISWYAILAYLSTVVVCLALAMELVNRKEVSYASSGE